MLPESSTPPSAEAPARGGRVILVPAIRPVSDEEAARKKEKAPVHPAKENAPAHPAVFGGEQDLKSKGIHQSSGYEKPSPSAPAQAPAYGIEAQYKRAQSSHMAQTRHPSGAFSSAGPITRKTGISEIMEKYPEMLEMLMATGLHCVGCQLSVFDDLETGFRLHGYEEDVIDSFIAKMNEAAAQKEDEGKTKGPPERNNIKKKK